jgi:hypothetical protein
MVELRALSASPWESRAGCVIVGVAQSPNVKKGFSISSSDRILAFLSDIGSHK